jgi:hypothetical protein
MQIQPPDAGWVRSSFLTPELSSFGFRISNLVPFPAGLGSFAQFSTESRLGLGSAVSATMLAWVRSRGFHASPEIRFGQPVPSTPIGPIGPIPARDRLRPAGIVDDRILVSFWPLPFRNGNGFGQVAFSRPLGDAITAHNCKGDLVFRVFGLLSSRENP